jgi:hypothetical protein
MVDNMMMDEESPFPGVPRMKTTGFIHNIVMKPTIRQKKKQTFEEYLEEVREWYKTRMAKEANEHSMVRSWVLHANRPSLKQDAELMSVLTLTDFRCHCKLSAKNFPRVCWSGQRGITCPYMDLCVRNPSSWGGIVKEGGRFQKADDPDTRLMKLIANKQKEQAGHDARAVL